MNPSDEKPKLDPLAGETEDKWTIKELLDVASAEGLIMRVERLEAELKLLKEQLNNKDPDWIRSS